MSRGRFKTGTNIPASGIYSVHHLAHRLPHEVTLLRGETFPKCQKCADAVTFKLVRVLTYQTAAKGLWIAPRNSLRGPTGKRTWENRPDELLKQQ